MTNSDDPLRDYNRWQDEMYLWEQSRPICVECGNHITGDYLWEIEGQNYCEDCIDSHRRYIDV